MSTDKVNQLKDEAYLLAAMCEEQFAGLSPRPEGPMADDRKYKPHRLIYDLLNHIGALENEGREANHKVQRMALEAKAALSDAVEEGLKDGSLPALQSATVIRLHSIIQIADKKY